MFELWDLSLGLQVRSWTVRGLAARCAVITPDGKQIAAAGRASRLALWDLDWTSGEPPPPAVATQPAKIYPGPTRPFQPSTALRMTRFALTAWQFRKTAAGLPLVLTTAC